METLTSDVFTLLADAFAYPASGMLLTLERGLALLPASSQKQSLAAFVEKVQGLTLGEWEELYTRTLDLNPLVAPYVGYQIWGETHQRGAFLSTLSRALAETGVEVLGELPDHLIPVLRYLGQTQEPLLDLVEVLDPAVQRMSASLRKADNSNPYLDLLEAVQSLCSALKKEPE